jgi:hypothetical protein
LTEARILGYMLLIHQDAKLALRAEGDG